MLVIRGFVYKILSMSYILPTTFFTFVKNIEMELSGKIFKVLPVESGEGRNGTWKKQAIVIETAHDRYPKKVCVSLWGDLVTNNQFIEGSDISVEFDIESREYNERWYTDVKVWRINKSNHAQHADTSNYQKSAAPKVEQTSPAPIDDDLPL